MEEIPVDPHDVNEDEFATQSNSEIVVSDDASLLETVSTTLVEVSPGIAVVFGEVPDGMELLDMTLIPSFDRTELNTALGSIGNIGTVVGNVAETSVAAQGLFRASSETMALLNNGAQMAVKDGAKIGAIFKDGQIIAQARFVPAGLSTAAAVAAIGPAVAMLAMQMQLGEISGLVKTNIAVTRQTMKAIRNEQWAELEAVTGMIAKNTASVRELEAVPDTLWGSIESSDKDLRKQMNLYQRNVKGHVEELGALAVRERRQYLETNAEAMVFDAYALLTSLKAYAEYQSVKAMRARIKGAEDKNETQLFELLTRDVPVEIQASRDEVTLLVKSLVRELRVIAELPGRLTMPLFKKRKDSKATQLTCAQLLEAIEPLADMLLPAPQNLEAPETVCGPEELALEPYLKVLRWFIEDDETLQCIAFPYESTGKSLIPGVLEKRVDASWDALLPGKAAAVLDKVASSTLVAVTSDRVLKASPRTFLREGELEGSFSLNDVRYVRPRGLGEKTSRPTLSITTEEKDLSWMFPADANEEQIDLLAAALSAGPLEGGQTASGLKLDAAEVAALTK